MAQTFRRKNYIELNWRIEPRRMRSDNRDSTANSYGIVLDKVARVLEERYYNTQHQLGI